MKLYKREVLDENTPTRRDGVSKEQELEWRRGYCTLIRAVGMKFSIPPWVIGSACLFCHRFYAVRSMKSNDRLVIATAALLLASKVEESPKGLKHLCEAALQFRFPANSPQAKLAKDHDFFEGFKEHILMAERALLYTVGFDLNLSHPYAYILGDLQAGREGGGRLLDQSAPENKDLIQVVFNLINDSYKTTLGLQYQPEDIAYAALYLATFFLGKQLPYIDGSFWTHFRIDVAVVQDISNQLFELYADSQKSKTYLAGRLPFTVVGPDGHLQADLQQRPSFTPQALKIAG